ncbi:MAG: hypothetical protein ABIR59_09305 [Gemmatimonadales bacterium]
MARAGCVPRVGSPEYGTIGVPNATGHELFTCNGVQGAAIRAAIHQHRENRRPVIQDVAYNLAGYTIRHFLGSQEYCDQWETSTYVGGRLTGRSYAWTNDCVTVSYYWDEWIPTSGDELPDQYPTGGGPYFGPDSPNEPRVDTMPKDDHICDPRVDVKCMIPLTALDEARIKDSLYPFIKNTSLITDTIARAQCDSARVWFDFATRVGYVFRGRTDSFYVDPAGNGYQHDAQSWNNNPDGTRAKTQAIHVDPRHLNAMKTPFGKAAVLRMIYHEVGHAVKGVDHVRTADYPNDSVYAAAGYPNSPYFNTMHSGACFQ